MSELHRLMAAAEKAASQKKRNDINKLMAAAMKASEKKTGKKNLKERGLASSNPVEKKGFSPPKKKNLIERGLATNNPLGASQMMADDEDKRLEYAAAARMLLEDARKQESGATPSAVAAPPAVAAPSSAVAAPSSATGTRMMQQLASDINESQRLPEGYRWVNQGDHAVAVRDFAHKPIAGATSEAMPNRAPDALRQYYRQMQELNDDLSYRYAETKADYERLLEGYQFAKGIVEQGNADPAVRRKHPEYYLLTGDDPKQNLAGYEQLLAEKKAQLDDIMNRFGEVDKLRPEGVSSYSAIDTGMAERQYKQQQSSIERALFSPVTDAFDGAYQMLTKGPSIRSLEYENGGEGIGVLGALGAGAVQAGNNFNDFLLGVAENYVDLTGGWLGEKVDPNWKNPFTGVREGNRKLGDAAIGDAAENATPLENILMNVTSSALNSAAHMALGGMAGSAVGSAMGIAPGNVVTPMQATRAAGASQVANMSSFALASMSDAYDRAEKDGAGRLEAAGRALTAGLGSLVANNDVTESFMKKMGLGIDPEDVMLARMTGDKMINTFGEGAVQWAADAFGNQALAEGTQEVLESTIDRAMDASWDVLAGRIETDEVYDKHFKGFGQELGQDFFYGYLSGALYSTMAMPNYAPSKTMLGEMVQGEAETTPENMAKFIQQVVMDMENAAIHEEVEASLSQNVQAEANAEQTSPLLEAAEKVAQQQTQNPILKAETEGGSGEFKQAIPAQLSETGEAVNVVGYESDAQGNPVLQVVGENGERKTVSISEVGMVDETMQELLNSDAAKSISGKDVGGYLSGYDSKIASAEEYANAYSGVYRRAAVGYDYRQAVEASEAANAFLNDTARLSAFAAGQSAYNQSEQQQATKGGIVRSFTNEAWDGMDQATRKRASSQMELLNAFAQRTGRSITVVDRLSDVGGNKVNALYNPKTGEIKVALNATDQAYAYVAAHELTHALRSEKGNAWSEFSSFVQDVLTRNGQSVDKLVNYQMERFGYSQEEALEEVICNTVPAMLQDERNVLDLYNRNQSLFARVMNWLKGLLDDVKKAGESLSKRSRSWEQMNALAGDKGGLQELYDRFMKVMRDSEAQSSVIPDEATLEETVVEGMTPSVMEAPVSPDGKPIKYSVSTYEEAMPKPIKMGRAKQLGFDITKGSDQITMKGATGKKKLLNVSGRQVTEALIKRYAAVKEMTAEQTKALLEKTLGYLDTLNKWFKDNVGEYRFVNLAEVNEASIIIDYKTGEIKFSCQVPNAEYKVNFDFTTVCRQREAVQRFVDDLSKEQGKNGRTKLEDISLTSENIFKLNQILKNAGYETACLGCFVEAKRYRINDQAQTLVNEWNALVKKENPNATEYFNFSNGDEELSKDEVIKLAAAMDNYNTSGTSKAIERAQRLAKLPEMQKLLKPSDFISRQGRRKIREFSPALESFLVSRFGQSGAKPAVGFMPYNSEIAALPETTKGKSFAKYLEGLGGARSNSFSDFIATHALDYLQRTMDMAAREFTAQCYTKVLGRALLFGMTGEKVNMSVMFDIDPDMHWSQAGLDSSGEYIVGDKTRAERVYKETGKRPFVQSIPFQEAVAIEHDPLYAQNCGIVGVGYSYHHIVKMLEDANIPYIIPYHRSNMPESVAKASNTAHATNYEDVQNTTRVTGYRVVRNMNDGGGIPSYATWREKAKKTDPSAMTFDMKAALDRNGGDAKATILEWQKWMADNSLTPVLTTAATGHGDFDLYASLRETKSPEKTAEAYMKYALDKGMLPVFFEFVSSDGYYKTLFDFSVKNLATGEVAMQEAVGFDWMDRFTAEDFIAVLDREMRETNEFYEQKFYGEAWQKVKDDAYEQLQYSLSDVDEDVQKGDELKEQILTMTAAHTMTHAEAMRLASRIAKSMNSTIRIGELADMLERTFVYAERSGRKKNLDISGLDTEINAIAKAILAKSKTLDTEHEAQHAEVRNALRTMPINLTEEQKNSIAGGYNAYRKTLFGKVRLRNDGKPLTEAWAELNALKPDLFPKGMKPEKMPEQLAYAAAAAQPIYARDGLDAEEAVQVAMDSIYNAYMSLSGVQEAAAEQNLLGLKLRDYRAVTQRFAAEHRKRFREAMRKVQRNAKAEIASNAAKSEADANARVRVEMDNYRAAMMLKAKEWQQEYRGKVEETQRKQRYRAQITRMTNDLVNRIEKATDKKYVQAGLERDLIEFLSNLDLGKRSNVRARLGGRIANLAMSMEKALNRPGEDNNAGMVIDESLVDELKTLAKEASELGSIDELTADQMRDMRDMIQSAVHIVNHANVMFTTAKKETTRELAVGSVLEMQRRKDKKELGGLAGKFDDTLNVGMLDSFRFFDRLGASAREVFHGLRNGLDTKTKQVTKGIDYARSISKNLAKSVLRGDKADKTKFTVSGGEIELTKGQVMELYCLSKREQAQMHLYDSEKGGIRTADKAKPVRVTKGDVKTIIASLSDAERDAADKLQRFLVDECSQWGNEATMVLYGRQKFTEENYYPIRVDSNSVGKLLTDEGNVENLFAIQNMGFTKAVKEGAKNALLIGDIFDTFARHVDNMSTFSAYAAPLADMMRWYNYQDGEYNVKTTLEEKFGTAGKNFIPVLIRDINGQTDKSYSTGIAETLIRRSKSAAIGANLRVAVQQPTAIARAATMISPKYIEIGAASTPKQIKTAIELAQKYCPIAKWKSLGFYETNIGKGLRDQMFGITNTVDNVIDKSMVLAGKMDEVTWAALWRACEAETREISPELHGEAFYKAVGDRLSGIIDRTQVVDTPLHRTQIMRSKNQLSKMLTAFKSEPMKTYNMVYEAIDRLIQNPKDKVAIKKFAITTASIAASAVLNAAAQSLMDATRDDDEEKTWLEKYAENFLGNVVDNVNLLDAIPWVSEVLSLAKGYEPRRADMQTMQKALYLFKEFEKVREGDSSWSAWQWIRKTSSVVSGVTGIPIENAYRDLVSLYNTVSMTMGGRPLPMVTEAASSSVAVKNLHHALLNGDKEGWERIRGKMGKNNSDIDTALAKHLLSKGDERIVMAYTAKGMGDGELVDRLRREMAEELSASGVISAEQATEIIDKEILLYESQMNPQAKEYTEKDLNAKLYKTADAVKAVKGLANGENSEEDVRLILSELVADSTAAEPEDTVKSAVLGELKREYLSAEGAKADNLLRAMETIFGVTKDDAQKWRNDQYASGLRDMVSASYIDSGADSSKEAKDLIGKLRKSGLSDSEIKQKFNTGAKNEWTSLMKSGDTASADKLKRFLIGLGLKGKNGKLLYTEDTFADWLED